MKFDSRVSYWGCLQLQRWWCWRCCSWCSGNLLPESFWYASWTKIPLSPRHPLCEEHVGGWIPTQCLSLPERLAPLSQLLPQHLGCRSEVRDSIWVHPCQAWSSWVESNDCNDHWTCIQAEEWLRMNWTCLEACENWHPNLLLCFRLHPHHEGTHEITATVSEWSCHWHSWFRKGSHLLCTWFLSHPLAFHATLDGLFYLLQSLQYPYLLSGLTQDMHRAGMSFLSVTCFMYAWTLGLPFGTKIGYFASSLMGAWTSRLPSLSNPSLCIKGLWGDKGDTFSDIWTLWLGPSICLSDTSLLSRVKCFFWMLLKMSLSLW